MWKRMIIVLVGQPLTGRPKCAVAAVILPVVSFVVFKVKVPLPEHDASASVMAGTSFEVFRSAVKTYFSCGVGGGGGVGAGVGGGAAVDGAGVADGAAAVPPHAPKRIAVAARLAKRRIGTSLL